MTHEEIRTWLQIMRKTTERTLRQIDGLLATLEEEPDVKKQEGCQHAHVVPVGTLGNPGGKFCLDCDQEVQSGDQTVGKEGT